MRSTPVERGPHRAAILKPIDFRTGNVRDDVASDCSLFRLGVPLSLLILLALAALGASVLFFRCETTLPWLAREASGGDAAGNLGLPLTPGGALSNAVPQAPTRPQTVKWDHGDGVVVYGDSCGHSKSHVAEILGLPHNSTVGQNRYYFNSTWMDFVPLNHFFQTQRAQPVPLCVLAHISGQVPCLEKACLIPLHMRPGHTDTRVLSQVVEFHVHSFLDGYKFDSILDAGANIGLASLVFGIQFPEAKIVAVELVAENYHVLEKNVAYLGNVVPINAGLFDSITALTIGTSSKRKSTAYMLQTEASGGAAVQEQNETLPRDMSVSRAPAPESAKRLAPSNSAAAPTGAPGRAARRLGEQSSQSDEKKVFTVTMDLILQLFGLQGFEFIKMDIEGAEKEVFTALSSSPHSWLEPLSLFVVETHDKVKPGSEQAVLDAFKQYPKFRRTKHGEYLTFFDPKRAPPSRPRVNP